MALGLAGVAAIVAIPLFVRSARHRHDRLIVESCANHAIQLRFVVLMFLEKEQHFPSMSDTRTAFARIIQMNQPEDRQAGWLTSYGSSCPESFLRDGSMGYVYVADGLTTQTVKEQSALVLFCPSDSHQRSEQHCHAVVARELRCLKSNAEMIDFLAGELNRARAGSVPYSTNAQALLEKELAARRKYARR